MRKLVDKISGLEIIKIHKPNGEVVAYQIEDRKARPPVLDRVPFLREARDRAKRILEARHANS